MATITATTAALRLAPADLARALATGTTVLVSANASQIVLGVPASFATDGLAGSQLRLSGSFTGTTLANLSGTVTTYTELAPTGQVVLTINTIAQPVRGIIDGGFTRAALLAESDSATGGSGGDRVALLGGNDVFDGAGGVDIFTVRGRRADYDIVAFDRPLAITDLVAGRDDADILFNTEIILFAADRSVVAHLPPAEAATARLYSAAFGRLPDADGLAFWLDRVGEGSSTFAIATGFSQTAEFASIYANSTNAQYIARLYQNVLGRPGEAGGTAYWTGVLNSGQDGRIGVLMNFAASPENVGRTEPWLFEI